MKTLKKNSCLTKIYVSSTHDIMILDTELRLSQFQCQADDFFRANWARCTLLLLAQENLSGHWPPGPR